MRPDILTQFTFKLVPDAQQQLPFSMRLKNLWVDVTLAANRRGVAESCRYPLDCSPDMLLQRRLAVKGLEFIKGQRCEYRSVDGLDTQPGPQIISFPATS
jgi:hypothetical protein